MQGKGGIKRGQQRLCLCVWNKGVTHKQAAGEGTWLLKPWTCPPQPVYLHTKRFLLSPACHLKKDRVVFRT